MDSENVEWVCNELTITAERARDNDITPEEYLAGLVAYTKRFADDYTSIDEDETGELLTDDD